MGDSVDGGASFELVQDAPFAAFQVGPGGTVLAWNVAAEVLFGIAAADAVGRPVDAVVPVSGGEPGWRALLTEGRGAHRVWTTQRADRRVMTCELWARPLRAGDVVCYAQDATARMDAETQQRVDGLLLRALLDNLDLIAWVLDPRGGILLHEGKGLERLGWSSGHLVGQNMLELFADTSGIGLLREGLKGQAAHFVGTQGGQTYENWQVPMQGEEGTMLVGFSLNLTDATQREQELQDKLDVIERQQRAMRAMAVPIIQVWDQVLCLPIVGLVDADRAAEIMDRLLQTVTRARARYAILDLTGVDVLDADTAGHLLGLIRALRLLGAEGVLTGIQPGVAETVVTLGVDLSGLIVRGTLRDALKYVLAALQRR